MRILNSTTYRFVPLAATVLARLRATLLEKAKLLSIKGTILLSTEGINLSLAGTPTKMRTFKGDLNNIQLFNQLSYNDSYSTFQPFQKLVVKIKKQVIPYTSDGLAEAAPYIAPETLRSWLKERRAFTLLDTRNCYEVETGSFSNAISLDLKHFRDFPEAAAALPAVLRQSTLVTFCTGGIRCEKASATLLQQGFKEVYQLQGGILSYFKKCSNSYYRGSCFVFDERESIRSIDMQER